MPDSGCFGVTAAGRARWDVFPEVVADDQFVNQLFAGNEVAIVDEVMSTVTVPSTLAALVRRKRRSHRGNLELAASGATTATTRGGWIGVIRAAPRRLVDLPAFLLVTAAVRISGWRERRNDVSWGADETSPRRIVMAPFGVRLRSVLFHHVAQSDSSFTAGLGVRMDIDVFRERIAQLARRYTPVTLDDVRATLEGDPLPPRALLVTIDDAYATVATHAAPILEDYAVPSVFFVNGGFIDHREMNIDNLVVHTETVAGPHTLARAVAQVRPEAASTGPGGVLADLVPTLRLDDVATLPRRARCRVGSRPLGPGRVGGPLPDLRPAQVASGFNDDREPHPVACSLPDARSRRTRRTDHREQTHARGDDRRVDRRIQRAVRVTSRSHGPGEGGRGGGGPRRDVSRGRPVEPAPVRGPAAHAGQSGPGVLAGLGDRARGAAASAPCARCGAEEVVVMSAEVSVLIVNWNTCGLLRDCLESLREAEPPGMLEIVVVDNGSTDGSIEMVRTGFPSVTVVENADNVGFAAAVNQADAVATAPYRLMLNSDTVVPPGVISGCRDHVRSDAEVAGVGCRLLNEDGSHQSSVFRFPSLLGLLFNATYLSQVFPDHPVLNWDRYGFGKWTEIRPADVVMGSFLLLDRAAVETDRPLLDEGYFFYGEETDLCRRFLDRGYRIEFHPGYSITHVHGASTRSPAQLAWAEEAKRRGKLRFLRMWRRPIVAWTANLILLLGLIPRWCTWTALDIVDRLRGGRSAGRRLRAGVARFHLRRAGRPLGARRTVGSAPGVWCVDMTLILLTGDGPEHRYVANRLHDRIDLASVVVERGLRLTPSQRLAQLRRRYSMAQLVSRAALAAYKRAIGDDAGRGATPMRRYWETSAGPGATRGFSPRSRR